MSRSRRLSQRSGARQCRPSRPTHVSVELTAIPSGRLLGWRKGPEISRAICKIITPDWWGTGYLIKGSEGRHK